MMSPSAIKLLNAVLVKLSSNSNRSVTELWATYCATYQVQDCDLATICGIRFGRQEANAYSTGTHFVVFEIQNICS